MKRRHFLKGMLAAGSVAATSGGLQLFSLPASAAPATQKIFVSIFLPGAPDGFNIVTPYFRSDVPVDIGGVMTSDFHLKEYHERRSSMRLDLADLVANDLGFTETGATGSYQYFNGSSYATGTGKLRLGLNSNMPLLKAMYDTGKVAVLPAVQHPFANQSHFDNRYLVESGVQVVNGGVSDQLESGWMNRYLSSDPFYTSAASAGKLVAVSTDSGVSQVLKASPYASVRFPVTSTGGSMTLPYLAGGANTQVRASIAANYGALPLSGGRAYDAQLNTDVSTLVVADQALSSGFTQCQTGMYPKYCNSGGSWSLMGEQAAHIIKASLAGLSSMPLAGMAMTFAGPWDTHAGQGGKTGAHGGGLASLDAGLYALYDNIVNDRAADGSIIGTYPERLDHVCILVGGEFGRTLFENGSAGSDHGIGANWFVIGGGVDGGVKLGKDALGNPLSYFKALTGVEYDKTAPVASAVDIAGKYLLPTLDTRDVYSAILKDFFEVPAVSVDLLDGNVARTSAYVPGVTGNVPRGPFVMGVSSPWAPENRHDLDLFV